MAQSPRDLNPALSPRALFGFQLRALRQAVGHSQASLGALLYVTGDAVATWEKGRSLPDQDIAIRLDRALGAREVLLASWSLAAHADSHADSTPNPLDSPDIPGILSPGDDPLAAATRAAADFGSWAERLNTGNVAVGHMQYQVTQFADAALTRPPAEVIAAAADLNREVFALLKGHHKPAHARDLYVVAGQSCAMLAWLFGDLGAHGAADMHARTAEVCAEMADHVELSAWVAVTRSKVAFWRGDYLAAAQLASSASRPGIPGTASVMLACQEADAYSLLGAADLAREAMVRADVATEAIRGVDSLGGLFQCAPGRRANYTSGVRLLLGDTVGALEDTDAALEQFAAGTYGFGTIAQVHITRARAHAAAGRFDGAAVAVRPVLDLPEQRRLSTLTGRLKPILRHLESPSARGSGEVAELRAEVAQFCRTDGVRALTSGHEEEH